MPPALHADTNERVNPQIFEHEVFDACEARTAGELALGGRGCFSGSGRFATAFGVHMSEVQAEVDGRGAS